jgi:hypothetical protein
MKIAVKLFLPAYLNVTDHIILTKGKILPIQNELKNRINN